MRPTETSRLRSWPEKKADFVEPMECEIVSKLREGSEWVYEVKLDGYRAIAVRSGDKVSLFSRRRKSFNQKYPYLVEALSDLPNGTVIDGEIVALDDLGRPEFNLLQNYRRDAGRIRYFVFDLLCHEDRDTTSLPLVERRDLLRTLKFQSPRIQLVEYLESSAANIVAAVKEQRPEGVIAKRRDSLYQPGRRTGAWVKYRINQGQELVIGGYFPGPHGFDSIIVGYYVNLPETQPSRFGRELDAETMKKAVWLRPELVAQIDFLECTDSDRLRHSKFVRLREDKRVRDIVKEHASDI